MPGTNYPVLATEHGAYQKTLTAATIDTVTFAIYVPQLEVVTDGTAAVYITLDGSAPTVGANGTWEIWAANSPVVKVFNITTVAAPLVVSLISAGTPKYSVSVASA
jgi:hypothetical protein